MARPFKRGILVTVTAAASGSLLACSGFGHKGDGEEIHGNPPYIPPATFPAAPFTVGQVLEAHDDQGRVIGHSGGNCWVELPFPEPPTSVVPPPTQAVNCPAEIALDPAFAQCEGGSIHLKSLGPATCECYWFGNPPPSPKDVACPVVAIPSLASLPPPTANPPAPTDPGPMPIGNPPPPTETRPGPG